MTALEVVAGLVLEDGRRWGEVAEPFQWSDAEAVLEGERPFHYETRPRGASKTTDGGAVGLAALVEQLPPGAQAFAFAADRDQAALLVREMAGFVARTPTALFGAQVPLVETWRVSVPSGASLTALPADGPGTYGLRPHFVFVDELAQWGETGGPKRVWEAVVSAMAKVVGARLVVLTTAGDPAHWSYGVLESARTSPLWRVHEVEGPCPWVDPDALAEQARLLLPSAFARLHLNRWTTSEERLTTLDDVRACVRDGGDLEPVKGQKYAITLDVGLTNDRTVVTVGHVERREAGATVVVDRQAVWQGSRAEPVQLAEVEAWIVQASETYHRAPLVFDPFQAAHLTQRLHRAGVRVEAFTFSQTSIGRLAVTLFRLLRDHLLELPDDDALVDELVHVKLVERSPGVYRIDHAAGQHDDRAVGIGLLAEHLVEKEGSRRGGLRSRDGEDDPMQAALRALHAQTGFPTPGLVVKPPAAKRRGIRVRW